ncbi:MAG: hypothetical protein GC179_11980 [Anaerolineaceae bacterium]|nr:hypothetical protein [Anaerolineaceae bacterium]
MTQFIYRNDHLNQISFPLGGIGTGSIGLAGNGRLIDWEIFNRPNKGSVNGFSHFAIKAERDGKVLDARVLHSDLNPAYMGELQGPRWSTYGWGPRREYLTGMPHFKEAEFCGEFPLAEITFNEERFPGTVKMRAFNPFIPLNDHDSGIPAAFFEISVNNTSDQPIDYTIAGTLRNPLPANNLNKLVKENGLTSVHLTCDSLANTDPRYGDLTLATDASQTSVQQYWFRGEWFDALEVYWRDFTTPGSIKNRTYPAGASGDQNEALLAAHIHVMPGETQAVRFVISWNFPNCINYWNPNAAEAAAKAGISPIWKNFYATLWQDSQASARYAFEHWQRLYDQTKLFKDALFASTLPAAVIDAVSANISILKTPTVLRLEDGTFYGWEGLHPTEGCCEGTCTHVWNYAQALPFLFPKLERTMRTADYVYNLRPDGGMPFRIQLPLGVAYWEFRPCVDGQFGGVMKTYRDWKICGDSDWLRSIWPKVKQSLEFAWSPANEDRWDPDKTGVIWGRQHHTLDMELFGPNSWLTGFYLGALKAAAEMAAHLGEHDSASEYNAIFERGKAWTDKHLFNGEFYVQRVDLKDREQLRAFDGGSVTLKAGKTSDVYWNSEDGEIKYQIGDGCAIDQILAQWHANLYGLGEIFDPNQTRAAVESLYKYNFKRQRDAYNPCRIYSLNDEMGMVISTWPESHYKPVIPVPYSQETMHGFEYSAAIQMMQYDMLEEGLSVIESIRERYDGKKRNPWNEIECGSNYARSMASYALLNTLSGFSFDMVSGMIGFDPILNTGEPFRCFWSLDSGWGEYVKTDTQLELRLLYGHIRLKQFQLPNGMTNPISSVTLNGQPVAFQAENGLLTFNNWVTINSDESLTLS